MYPVDGGESGGIAWFRRDASFCAAIETFEQLEIKMGNAYKALQKNARTYSKLVKSLSDLSSKSLHVSEKAEPVEVDPKMLQNLESLSNRFTYFMSRLKRVREEIFDEREAALKLLFPQPPPCTKQPHLKLAIRKHALSAAKRQGLKNRVEDLTNMLQRELVDLNQTGTSLLREYHEISVYVCRDFAESRSLQGTVCVNEREEAPIIDEYSMFFERGDKSGEAGENLTKLLTEEKGQQKKHRSLKHLYSNLMNIRRSEGKNVQTSRKLSMENSEGFQSLSNLSSQLDGLVLSFVEDELQLNVPEDATTTSTGSFLESYSQSFCDSEATKLSSSSKSYVTFSETTPSSPARPTGGEAALKEYRHLSRMTVVPSTTLSEENWPEETWPDEKKIQSLWRG